MNKKLFPKIMDLLLDTVCAVDLDGRFVYVSASCLNLFGYTQEQLIGTVLFDLLHPDDRGRTRMAATQVAEGQPVMHFTNRYIHKDGHIVHIRWSARWSEADQLRLAVARDVTALEQAKRMQAALYQISEAGQAAAGLSALYEHIHQIIHELLPLRNFSVVLYDREQQAISIPYCVGETACVGEGASAHQPQLSPDSPMTRVIRSGEPLLTTVPVKAHPGSSREWLGVPLSTNRDVIGALIIQGGVDTNEYTKKDQELLQFVSAQIAAAIERKQAETHLRYIAGHDPLTDLPNRSLFQDRLEVALNRARRDSEYLAVLYLDLDDFKQVNDIYGHEAGDQLLCKVAKRLTGCLRASDTVARMGGDEFTVLAVNIQGASCVACVTKKIRTALKKPFLVLDQSLTISASIGSALFPDDGQDAAQLIRYADAQMYLDKGRNKPAPN